MTDGLGKADLRVSMKHVSSIVAGDAVVRPGILTEPADGDIISRCVPSGVWSDLNLVLDAVA